MMPADVTIDPFTGNRYELLVICDAGTMRHYRLRVPGSGHIQSTDIVFAEQHTIIFGDLCPGRNGVVSEPRYGLSFFSVEQSLYYLAEKFLGTDWHRDLAHSELDEMVADDPSRFTGDDNEDAVSDLHGMIDDYDIRGFGDWFMEHEFESENIPGHGYSPRDLELLSLINRRFAALYAALLAS